MILQILKNTGISNNLITKILIAVIILFAGLLFSKSYNKYRNWGSSTKNLLILNLIWFVFNLTGILVSPFIFLEFELFDFFILNYVDVAILFLNVSIGFFVFKVYYKINIRDTLISLVPIQAILLGIMLLLNLLFEAFYIGFLSNNEPIDFINFIIMSIILSGILVFFVQWGDKIQLIDSKSVIYIIAIIPGLIFLSYLYIALPQDFFGDILPYFSFLISLILAQIGKMITYKTIPEYNLEKLTPLEKDKILMKVEDLRVHYPLLKGILRRQYGNVKAVDGISFDIKTGETVGLVGESGCGKTTIALTLTGLVNKTSGDIMLDGEVLPIEYSNLIRKKVQMVFQDPDASMNPRMKVVDIIAEPLKNILGITNKPKLRNHILNLLDEVSLKQEHLDRFPHEFSGGQKQRIVIARALVCNPKLILLDEPTSALDVSVQAQILNLLKKLQNTYNFGFLFITHDLSVVKHIADRVAVMYLGKFVEVGTTEQVFSNPSHPYTKALLASRSVVTAEDQQITFTLEGDVPSPITPPPGCAFNPRCYSEHRNDECWKQSPHKIDVEDGHYIWCVNEDVLKEK